MSNLSRLSQILIDESKRLEPCVAEVCADEVSEIKVVYENTDFSVASNSHATIFGLRTVVNNRMGFITTNSLDEAELKDKAREAQMVARLSPESQFHLMAEKQKTAAFYSIYDDKLALAQPKDIFRWAQLLVDESRKDSSVTLDRVEVSVTVNKRLIQNSNGVFQEVRLASCNWFVMGMAKKGDEVTSFDYEGNSSGTYPEIESKIKDTAREFRESVVESLGARGAKSYKGPVLFHPSAVGSLLAGVIGFNVNGRAQQDGMSKWKDQLGKQVAHKEFSLLESPLDETRVSDWSPFDREGVLTETHEIVKNGTLQFTAHNCFSAARGKTKPTGNAVGSSRSLPSIGLHGLTVATGKSTLNDLNSALKTGLVLKRFSGNSDPVSGQFSGVAKNSWWVENGERSYPLKEVMLAGNMFELLNNIKLIGSESFRQMGSFDSPYILIDNVSVTSG
ncbi:MAG: metallopeptidase TldD-related protein [Oligoflexia bacterium]|nr:metallopeptidase TldD-related protein [Oligoflexia bacterium]